MATTHASLVAATASQSQVLGDLGCILGLALLVLGAGLGLRDPWPADEPRFVLIARDMLANGAWFVPQIGGDVYADKPPMFFWFIALGLLVTDSPRVAFLMPGLCAALGTLVLVYDLARRLWGRAAAVGAALLLLSTVQFALQARSAQIDGFLLFWTTLALYGIARHLLLGSAWAWYGIGGLAAGIGVITKGVGFLPLLLLLPYAVLRVRGFTGLTMSGSWRWALAPAAALAGIGLWLGPMLLIVAASNDPTYFAYRDEIFFQQTVQRYASAWHHHKPIWYFVLEVIPLLWLPGIALLPWLVQKWRAEWHARDGRILLFLAWAVLVVLFFSLSPGKRGIYVLPALPAFVLAAAPHLPDLWQRAGPQRVGAALAALLGLVALGASIFIGMAGTETDERLQIDPGVVSALPLLAIAVVCLAALLYFRERRGLAAFAATLWTALVLQGLWINPMINGARSGRDFVAALERAAPRDAQLGLLAYREQFLLYFSRPTVNFGHARWREGSEETEDAAAWLAAAPDRVLLVNETQLEPCFASTARTRIGTSGGHEWWLVRGRPNTFCAAKGDPTRARVYYPPRPSTLAVSDHDAVTLRDHADHADFWDGRLPTSSTPSPLENAEAQRSLGLHKSASAKSSAKSGDFGAFRGTQSLVASVTY